MKNAASPVSSRSTVRASCTVAVTLLGVACGAHRATDAGASDTTTVDDVALADAAVTDVPWTLADAYVPDATVSTARPLAPLTSSIVRATRPVLRWLLPAGATDVLLDFCSDRACATVEQSTPASGHGGSPATDLAPGVHWWRLRSASTGTSAVWELVVRAPAGRQLADDVDGTFADFDRDGLADLAVGATHSDTESGRVYLHAGHRGGLPSAADTVLSSPGGTGGHFGWAIAASGDLDGDGFDELVVAAPDLGGGNGAVYVYAGSATGIDATSTPRTLSAPVDHGNFGAALAGGGDVDGDGYADLIVTAPNADSSAGHAYVFLGGPTGVHATPDAVLSGRDGAAGTFGSAVSMVGDANHDGLADVVIGASSAAVSVGAAYVYYGSPTGLAATADLRLDSPSTDSGQFGASIAAAGDVDADGYADAIIAAPETLSGDVWIYRGGPAGFSQGRTITLSGPDGPRGGFGWAVAGAGDLDHDGYDDLTITAVCAPFHLDPDGGYPTCGAGRAHVFTGSAEGTHTTPAFHLNGPDGEPASFGWAVVGAHDLDGDGFDDLAIGAQATGSYAGSVYLYLGAAAGLTQTPAVVLTGTDGAGANFGWSLALRDSIRRPAS